LTSTLTGGTANRALQLFYRFPYPAIVVLTILCKPSRVGGIDTKECPVFCLTGVYDWSCPPELTQKTVAKIKGAQFKAMQNLGHFPQVGQYQKSSLWWRRVFFPVEL
jgi:pimeloyl-ACP methyl ester carboxylesterase